MKKLLQLTFTEDQRLQFRDGNLIKVWKDAYPEIFDDDDIRLAWSQGT